MSAILFETKDVPTGPVFGLFCLISAIVMGMQTYQSYKEGRVYNGRTSRVLKSEEPVKYRVWLSGQTLLVVLLTLFAVYAFIPSIFR